MANKKNKIREYTLVLDKNEFRTLEQTRCRDWYGDTFYDSEIARMMRELFNMNRLAIEQTYVIAFDHKRQIKGVYLVGQGSESTCPVPSDSLFTFLLIIGARSFMTVHNHPGGSVQASDGEIQTTQNLQDRANLFNMLFLGSMIISENDYYVYGGAAEQRRIDEQNKQVAEKVTETTEKTITVNIDGMEIEGSSEEIKSILAMGKRQ